MSARYELKYLVGLEARLALQGLFAHHLVPGEHVGAAGDYPVLSQYFDGPGLPFYREKVAGVQRRVKVRLRAYAWSFAAAPQWFLEAKHRDGATVAKRRLALARGAIDARAPLTWNALGAEAGPFLALRERWQLEPCAGVWYQRSVLVSPAGDLRVTWDSSIRALHAGEDMSASVLYDRTREIVPEPLSVLEIKAAQTLPSWLARAIRAHALVPESVSKYVRASDALGLSRKVLVTC